MPEILLDKLLSSNSNWKMLQLNEKEISILLLSGFNNYEPHPEKINENQTYGTFFEVQINRYSFTLFE